MSLIHETDFGTPRSKSETMVTLTIDGRSVTVPEGTSIMRAAMEAGTQIPKLCATDMVDAFGSCRLCLIEIEGRAGTPASCTTPAMPGLVVHTQTERLKKLRKGVMELYISDHPLDCLTCAANGDCELQDMAGAVGLRDVRYGYDGENHVFGVTPITRNASSIRWSARRSPTRGAKCHGTRHSILPPRSSRAFRPNTAAMPLAASPRRAAPTKRPIWSRN
jgi:formate dehydrogenase major subunit